MLRGIIVALSLLIALPAAAQQEEQALVDRATLAVQELMSTGENTADALSFLRRSRAVMVCPRLFRAGFILGGEGGSCVLVGRDGAGSWSSPAFYTVGSGSVGLQIGVQDAMVIMMIMTDRGLGAVMDSQFKIGADASVALATIGGGIQGSTTAAAGADIVAVARSRGLFAGISLSGSVLSYRPEAATAYYGRQYSARQIVMAMEAHNPGSDPLRAMLLRFGARQ
ncbi:lipid-binding SYLF domain-containing protein [Falsiroseomonas stagni]|uniref:Lipid-binding SYLF domain-containing protein n=1 Tax=Falsiroseomonas stagni DSM 19981 TaxID=1123062 RepID=A0A1I3YEN1_9PROT|nr:lipid-binding SYLF domain-containing protein [Falsiroseomonas stagni]SFK29829.1 Lipid-binding SYLF domain-containing protein [Falsiroseomonas stagni DSM 19981]